MRGGRSRCHCFQAPYVLLNWSGLEFRSRAPAVMRGAEINTNRWHTRNVNRSSDISVTGKPQLHVVLLPSSGLVFSFYVIYVEYIML